MVMTRAAALAALVLLCACSPALDWRQMRPDGFGVEVSFPCRPASHARAVSLGGQIVSMTIYACQVRGVTFGLSSADLGDVRRVDAALADLAGSAAANIGAASADGEPAAVPGMTPQPRARRYRLTGQLPDGRAVAEQAVVFAYGSRVYQATVLGSAAEEESASESASAFLAGIRIRP